MSDAGPPHPAWLLRARLASDRLREESDTDWSDGGGSDE
jgi:hypothetical protein